MSIMPRPAVKYKNPVKHCRRAKELRKRASLAEKLLWDALREIKTETGLKFRRQHPVYPYITDFACILCRLIVEVDGTSHDVQQEYDKKREVDLRQEGWFVIRFTNDDVLSNMEGVVSAIIEKAEQLMRQQTPPTPCPSRTREGDAQIASAHSKP